jgi:type II secretory ATPase GspE/PulE/Tfp pilus assembly ATPase PilB-like protein
VKAESKRVCQVCGTVLSNDSESCPVCALQGALRPSVSQDEEAVIKFVHSIPYEGVELGASDIMFQEFPQQLRVSI